LKNKKIKKKANQLMNNARENCESRLRRIRLLIIGICMALNYHGKPMLKKVCRAIVWIGKAAWKRLVIPALRELWRGLQGPAPSRSIPVRGSTHSESASRRPRREEHTAAPEEFGDFEGFKGQLDQDVAAEFVVRIKMDYEFNVQSTHGCRVDMDFVREKPGACYKEYQRMLCDLDESFMKQLKKLRKGECDAEDGTYFE
jgi:hypothetical protein